MLTYEFSDVGILWVFRFRLLVMEKFFNLFCFLLFFITHDPESSRRDQKIISDLKELKRKPRTEKNYSPIKKITKQFK